jgi:hypothetical protein
MASASDGEAAMLELRPNCECCDRDLPPDSKEARICTYECTFCATCVETILGGVCPNCGGNFATRPIRPAAKLLKHPASAQRVLNPEGCKKTAPK